VIQSNTPAPPVELINQNGDLVELTDFHGKVVVMYFGYTYCPDLCPMTLATVDQALDQIGPAADDVQVVMVSVDPQRDTPEALGDYLANFNDDFVGLTGSPEDLAAVATIYGTYFEIGEGDVDSGYLVNHTSNLVVVDREGFLKLVMPPLVATDELAADLEYLL
jgi:protein SCO1/2